MGGPLTNPGFVDIYDLTNDCRHPVLKSSLPMGILGHEGTFAPDGNTFYASSTAGHTITAVDVSNPLVPRILWVGTQWIAHGMNVSDDGTRLYVADIGDYNTHGGLTILDVSQVQQRALLPAVRVVSYLSWPDVSVPQVPLSVTIGGHPYLVEIDEFARRLSSSPSAVVGAARIIDIGDDVHPRVVSNIRLEVNTPSARVSDEQNDPMANTPAGYMGHYCAVPSRTDPGIVACSFILSGMRVFDIRDPLHPREIAYANFPTNPTAPGFSKPSSFVMSAPAFVPARGEMWFTDGNSGFYAVKFTNGVWPFTAPRTALAAAKPRPAAVKAAVVSRPNAVTPPPPLAATGRSENLLAPLALLAAGVVSRRARGARAGSRGSSSSGSRRSS